MKLVLFIAVLFALVLVVFFGKTRPWQRAPDYAQRTVMTDNEAEFFARLVSANPGGYVFPQVALSALIAPTARDAKGRMAAFRRISQKRVDYAICTGTLELVCIVELDDRTHDARHDAERDAILTSAGITSVRWQSTRKPSVAQIRERFEQLRADALLRAGQTGQRTTARRAQAAGSGQNSPTGSALRS